VPIRVSATSGLMIDGGTGILYLGVVQGRCSSRRGPRPRTNTGVAAAYRGTRTRRPQRIDAPTTPERRRVAIQLVVEQSPPVGRRLGEEETFDRAVGVIANEYADLTKLDHKTHVTAIRDGRIDAAHDLG